MREPTGVVFDIKEFALYDGPGLRCTVFMKGCPLRCSWCHNPEGLSPSPEPMRTAAGTRMVGIVYTADELETKLRRYAPLFADGDGSAGSSGGITFSGGEPLLQADFIAEMLRRLHGDMHLLLQTSGYAPTSTFLEVAGLADTVYFDCKLFDPAAHRRQTGVDNALILTNLAALAGTEIPYRLRMPLIPGVTDTEENMSALRRFIIEKLRGPNRPEGLDFLPYNPAGGGKYQGVGRVFAPGYDASTPSGVKLDYFKDVVAEVHLL